MHVIETSADIMRILDPYEHIFAIAMRQTFPHLRLVYDAEISVMSGKRHRTTCPDFLLTNNKEDRLYFEIAGGEYQTGRKARQHKTAKLAGLGNRHITFYGHEVESLNLDDPVLVKTVFFKLLYSRFSPKLFDFELCTD